MLVQVAGTPLAGTAALDPLEFVRTIAVARILMPASVVRLSAGRESMDDELQALCFLAGANSIFYGDKLLTTGNPAAERDRALFERLGIHAAAPACAGARAPAGSTEAVRRRVSFDLDAGLAARRAAGLYRQRRVGSATGARRGASTRAAGSRSAATIISGSPTTRL